MRLLRPNEAEDKVGRWQFLDEEDILDIMDNIAGMRQNVLKEILRRRLEGMKERIGQIGEQETILVNPGLHEPYLGLDWR